jgi:hypothetical protein
MRRASCLSSPVSPRGTQPRGVATLTVVMVLFFVMALVAAYTNRSMLFEQRISLGHYRSARAAVAAEASVNWALALLNGGRINSECRPSVDPDDVDFRRMSTAVPGPAAGAPPGSYVQPIDFDTATERVWGCLIANGVVNCACPTTTQPNPVIEPPENGRASAFHITNFMPEGTEPRGGTLGLLGFACGSLGEGNNDCSRSVGRTGTPQVDGISGASQVVGLLRALPLAPQATLTAGGAVNAAAGTLLLANPDNSSGYTVLSGGGYTPGTGDRFVLPPGSTGEGRQHTIDGLSDLAALANNGWFRNLFAMNPATYALQPASQVVNCAAGCTEADVAAALLGFPRSPIILNGPVNIAAAVALGTAVEPAMLVINGALTISGNAAITGFVHANSVAWNAATASLSGAMMTPGNFTVGAGAVARMSFDRPVIDLIKYRYGSFVRASGTWNSRESYR